MGFFMNPLTVLLVEDDQDACCAFTSYAESLDEIVIVGVTGNAAQAVQDIQDLLPDAVILDLELHHGQGSGFDVLQSLGSLSRSTKPYILITTNNSSRITYEYARQLGADFIYSKHQTDYSEKNSLDFLCMMKSAIQSAAPSPRDALARSSDQKNQRVYKRITTELTHIGISQKAKGYQYLIDAILLLIDTPQQQRLSTIIGSKYGKTEASIERAMQNAINRAWKTTDIDDLLRYYEARINSERGVPTSTEFIYYYANKIRAEY